MVGLDELWDKIRSYAERVRAAGDYMVRKLAFEMGSVEGTDGYDSAVYGVLYGSGLLELVTNVPEEPFDGAEEFFYSKVFPLFMTRSEREELNKIMLSSTVSGGDVEKEVDAYIRRLAMQDVVENGNVMVRGVSIAMRCRDWYNAFQIAYLIVKNELGGG